MIDQELAVQRASSALMSLFIGDSLAMPVHWYYNLIDIEKQFPGGIKDYEDAPAFHPSSIMSLHSTSKGGRARRSDSGAEGKTRDIVGDVILKGKREHWGRPNQHYHHQMRAGENTLNAHCAMSLMQSLVSNRGKYNEDKFLDAYVALMTADDPMHPDTYAESYHRGFFANIESGKPRNQCGAVTHDTASIGGLVTIAPLVISERLRGTSLEEVQKICVRHLYLTHPNESLANICTHYVELVDRLLFRDAEETAKNIIKDIAKRSIGLNVELLVQKSVDDRHVCWSYVFVRMLHH